MDLMTVEDVCQKLQVSRKTIYRMIAKGDLPAPRKIGNFRKVYFIRVGADRKLTHP